MITFAVLMINMISVATISGIKPITTLYAAKIGITPAEISIIVAGYALLPAFLALQIGKWTDKFGIRVMVNSGNGLMLIALILSAVYPSYITFVLQQTIIGVAFTCLMVSLQKCAGNLSGDLDRSIANLSMTASFGLIIGPILSTPLYDHYGYQVSCSINILLMSIAFLSGYLVKKADWEGTPLQLPTKQTDKSKGESVWFMMRQRNLRNAIIISGLVLSNRELFSAYFPLLASEMGISATMIGILLSISGGANLIVRFSQSALVRKFGRMNVLTWSLYISGFIYVLTPFSPWMAALIVLVSILGAGLGLGQPLSTVYALQASPPDRQGEVLGLRITVNRISQFSIPLIFGGIGGLAGVSAVFWASGVVLTFFGYLTRPLPADQQHAQTANSSM